MSMNELMSLLKNGQMVRADGTTDDGLRLNVIDALQAEMDQVDNELIAWLRAIPSGAAEELTEEDFMAVDARLNEHLDRVCNVDTKAKAIAFCNRLIAACDGLPAVQRFIREARP